MAKVARSSATQMNPNILRFHKVTVFVQTFAGSFESSSNRSPIVEDDQNIEYSVYLDGNFSQSGLLAQDGSVDVYIPGGKQAQLLILGTEYLLEPHCDLAPHDTLLGIQQRLKLLGYLANFTADKLDAQVEQAVLDFQIDHQLAITGCAMEQQTYDAIHQAFEHQGESGETQT